MTDKQKYQNLLDGFFEGTLSTSEESTLMNRLATDADLKSEFEFQKDIINTIKESRKLELKSRLDNISIKWYDNISNGWKVAATATIVTVSTLTAYYFIDMQEEFGNRIDLAQNEILVDAFDTEVADIPQKPHAIANENIEKSKTIENTEQVKEAVTQETVIHESADQVVANTDRTVEVIGPDVIEDFEEVDNMELENVSSGDINTMTPSREDLHSSVEINTVLHKKYNFHYNFSHGTLTLYGNFEDVPYEILEINSTSGKSFYLNYKDNFYNIISTNNIIPLQPVTNESLINELKIVKENK
jgi:hypothetical protein